MKSRGADQTPREHWPAIALAEHHSESSWVQHGDLWRQVLQEKSEKVRWSTMPRGVVAVSGVINHLLLLPIHIISCKAAVKTTMFVKNFLLLLLVYELVMRID